MTENPAGLGEIRAAIRSGGLSSEPRAVLEPLLVGLMCHWRPANTHLPAGYRDTTVQRAARRLLDWLEGHPGDTWQERWQLSESAGVYGTAWYEHAGFGRPSVRAEVRYAVNAMLVLQAIRPSHVWIMESRRDRLWGDFVELHDPEIFARVTQMTAQAPNADLTTWRVRANLVNLCLVTGRSLADLTAEDFIEGRRELISRGRVGHRMHTTWEYARKAGLLQGQPDYMLEVTSTPPLTPTELVARYDVHDPDIRQLFTDYLTERATETDFSTLSGIAIHLLRVFWCDIQDHQPGINTIRLTPEQATAWRTRAAILKNGKPRKDWVQAVSRVRTFYADISQWAHEDPAKWARWVAPNPVPARATQAAGRRTRQRQLAELQERTRSLAPVVPQLVDSVTAHLARCERLLAAANEVDFGEPFEVDGEQWHRNAPGRNPTQRALSTFAIDPSGSRVSLSQAEDLAFWTWATVEVLRHSGIRSEEMLELSHLSIRPFRKPSGEILPLLQIAPSKTDTERVIPASPALAHALSRIVQRHTHMYGGIPVTVRRDELERTFSPPLPYLFQRLWASGRHSVLSPKSVRVYLKAAADRAGLVDNDGRALTFRPHDFRRLFLTDLVSSGFPIHIAAQFVGHQDLNTTRGYVAIYPTEVFDHYEKFLDRRRAERPDTEYRQPTADELDTFAEHFGRRKVELGDCVRPYGSGCSHEHACLRCQFLQVPPVNAPRLKVIGEDLERRIDEATTQTWLGDVEQLRITLHRLRDKQIQLGEIPDATDLTQLIPAQPVLGLPDHIQ